MTTAQSYSIVQYYPDPDRHEGVNVGVLLFDPVQEKLYTRFTSDLSRIARSFGKIDRWFIELSLKELETRINRELRFAKSSDVLKRFQLMRSNNVRLTPMMPSFGRDGEAEVQRLFEELVGVAPRQPRRTKVSIRLKRELKRLDVLKMFDQNPESISLPRYSLILRPDLGIRREVYNVISAARFDDPERGIEQAGKHALEGRAVHKNLGMKLVVVGDFGEQPVDYFEAIREDLQQANTALYRMDNLEKLAQDYLLH